MMRMSGRKTREMISQYLLWFFLGVSLVIFTIPFLVMISNSFAKFGFALPYPPRVLPDQFNLSSYQHIFELSFFPAALVNSVLNTTITVLVTVFISSLSAYGFARIDFPLREPLYKLYLFTLMVPTFLNIIPQFLILQYAVLPGLPNGLVGTRTGLILVYTATSIAGYTFFLRGFFKGLPNSLSESVIMDGGGHGAIFFRIMLPLSKPAIGTMAIFAAQGYWEEYFTARILVGSNDDMVTLPMLLQRLRFENMTRFDWMFAASVLTLIPILVMFVVFQKKMVVGGLTQGALKE